MSKMIVYCTPATCRQAALVNADNRVPIFMTGAPTYTGAAYDSFGLVDTVNVTGNMGTLVEGHHNARVPPGLQCPNCHCATVGFIRLQVAVGEHTRYFPVVNIGDDF